MRLVLWLFPGSWRARYGDEFLALLEDQPSRRHRLAGIGRCLIAAHLDHAVPPSQAPAPLRGRSLVVALVAMALVASALGFLFFEGASYSALTRAADVLGPLLLIVPIAMVLAGVWALRGEAQTPLRAALPGIGVNAFLLVAIGLAIFVALRPQLGFFASPPLIELRPFHDVLAASTPAGRLEAVATVAGNIGLFSVLGFALALRLGRRGTGRVIGLAVAFALILEVAQSALGTGRPSDVTDVLARAFGACVGYAAWRLPSRASADASGSTSETPSISGPP